MSFKKIDCLLLLIVPLFMSACHSSKTEKPKTDAALSIPKEVNQVVAVGRVMPLKGIVNLAVEDGGIVQTVAKEEGDSVRKGETIIVLNASELSLKQQQTQKQLAIQQEQNKADAQNLYQQDIQLKSLLDNIKVSEKLLSKGAETQEHLNQLYTDRDVLQSQVLQNKKSISVGEAKIKELQTQMAIATNSVNKSVVTAPSDGVLLTQEAKVGAALHPLEAFSDFAPAGPWVVEAEVDEMFANRLKVGQKVSIHYIGHQESLATGEIMTLAPNLSNKSIFSDEPAEKQDRRVRRLKVKLDSQDNLLLNSKVECNIQIDK